MAAVGDRGYSALPLPLAGEGRGEGKRRSVNDYVSLLMTGAR